MRLGFLMDAVLIANSAPKRLLVTVASTVLIASGAAGCRTLHATRGYCAGLFLTCRLPACGAGRVLNGAAGMVKAIGRLLDAALRMRSALVPLLRCFAVACA